MKTSYASAIVLALSALAAGHASATDRDGRVAELAGTAYSTNADQGKTREAVLADLAQAQRTGDIVANIGGENSGLKLNQVFPQQYAAKTTVQGKTRAQVLSELAEAQRTGDVVANLGGNRGLKQNQAFEHLDSSN